MYLVIQGIGIYVRTHTKSHYARLHILNNSLCHNTFSSRSLVFSGTFGAHPSSGPSGRRHVTIAT